jgi:hypothetical protein
MRKGKLWFPDDKEKNINRKKFILDQPFKRQQSLVFGRKISSVINPIGNEKRGNLRAVKARSIRKEL